MIKKEGIIVRKIKNNAPPLFKKEENSEKMNDTEKIETPSLNKEEKKNTLVKSESITQQQSNDNKTDQNPLVKSESDQINSQGLDEQINNLPKMVYQAEEKTNEVDYANILNLLKTPSFNEFVGTLDVKDKMIISLISEYFYNKYYHSEELPEIFKINETEILTIIKNSLLLYKKRINDLIDSAVSLTTDELKKTRKLDSN